jgi:hypothetical protein
LLLSRTTKQASLYSSTDHGGGKRGCDRYMRLARMAETDYAKFVGADHIETALGEAMLWIEFSERTSVGHVR